VRCHAIPVPLLPTGIRFGSVPALAVVNSAQTTKEHGRYRTAEFAQTATTATEQTLVDCSAESSPKQQPETTAARTANYSGNRVQSPLTYSNASGQYPRLSGRRILFGSVEPHCKSGWCASSPLTFTRPDDWSSQDPPVRQEEARSSTLNTKRKRPPSREQHHADS
jgi:hypothetical protein